MLKVPKNVCGVGVPVPPENPQENRENTCVGEPAVIFFEAVRTWPLLPPVHAILPPRPIASTQVHHADTRW
jgi:hypothetical protein